MSSMPFDKSLLFALVLWTTWPSNAASAGETSSAYTKIDLRRQCSHARGTEVEDYGSWRCEGYAGVAVWLGGGDQHMYVSFGSNAAKEIAAGETLAPFNDFYEGVIEWRLERQPDGTARPFATIARWNVRRPSDGASGKTSGRVLVVTRLGPGGVCHVGYVDARANADANDLAREIADQRARVFRCGMDKPVIFGEREKGFALVSPTND
jgi:hypothetical protein